MKDLTVKELIVLVDALRSQARIGHLQEHQQRAADRLLFKLIKEIDEREVLQNEL